MLRKIDTLESISVFFVANPYLLSYPLLESFGRKFKTGKFLSNLIFKLMVPVKFVCKIHRNNYSVYLFYYVKGWVIMNHYVAEVTCFSCFP